MMRSPGDAWSFRCDHPLPGVLGYDPLPPGSDIRVEFRSDGVQLTIPAGEVPAEVLRAAKVRAMIPATICAALLILAAMLFARVMLGGIRIERAVFPWAVGIYLIFCGAIFVLIWQMLALGRCEMLRRG